MNGPDYRQAQELEERQRQEEDMDAKRPGLALLRVPFPEHQISKLPKPTKAQTDAVRANFKAGIRCQICGAWHHPDVIHLDYVGHAALTDRLLDADPYWTWEPLALGQNGYPVIDENGGMWIKLTVCGITRLGYGHAGDKSGGDAIKEVIGDALRNAAMRFGAALDLWHKGDLHLEDDQPKDGANEELAKAKDIALKKLQTACKKGTASLKTAWVGLPEEMRCELAGELDALKAAAIEWESKLAEQA